MPPRAKTRLPKRRHPRAHVQVNLRMPEDERSWLVAQAQEHRTTLNAEMMARIMRGRDSDELLSIRRLVDYSERLLRPYQIEAHERAHYGNVLRATDDIVHLIIAEAATDAIRAAVDKYQTARRVLDLEAGRKITGRGTSGGAS
jgi:hypothetical protein